MSSLQDAHVLKRLLRRLLFAGSFCVRSIALLSAFIVATYEHNSKCDAFLQHIHPQQWETCCYSSQVSLLNFPYLSQHQENREIKTNTHHSPNLPSDPFTYLVPHPHVPDYDDILIKLYHYGPLLAKASIYTVISEAVRDVNGHRDDYDDFIGTKERLYDDDGRSQVVLLLHPGREMVWYAWGQALRGLYWFTVEYDGVELFFDVFKRVEGGELRLQGTGALAR